MTEVELRGTVFDIQRYSIHDGPGIRTTVFLNGCPLKCFWCQNPESQSTRRQLLFSQSRCTLCGACVDACPSGANSLVGGAIVIDRSICSGCGECVEPCLQEARSLVGDKMTVAEVVEEVLRDRGLYENSGGGVTLSGGDPLVQAEFSLAIAQACKERGLHVAVETCGFASWRTLEPFVAHCDLFLLDIKCLDSERHREATGRGNVLILRNAKRLVERTRVRLRMPLVPGFNDRPEDTRALLRFATEALGLSGQDIDLLRYNNFGEAKYDRLGWEDRRPCAEPQSEELIAELRAILDAG